MQINIFAILPSQDKVSIFTFWLNSPASLYITFTERDAVLVSSTGVHERRRYSPHEQAAVCCLHVDSSFTIQESRTVFSALLCLTDLLQQLLFYEFKLHADGHLSNELVTPLLGHLFAVSQVDVTYASTALEIGQRLVSDPVTDCREKQTNN